MSIGPSSSETAKKRVALLPPIGSSLTWINQIEIYFSIVQRKVLTLNDFSSLSHFEDCLMDFQKRYEQTASQPIGQR